MLNCNQDNIENLNNIQDFDDKKDKVNKNDKKNFDYLTKIQESRKEQMEAMEKQKEKMKKNRMKLASYVLKQGRERAENEKLDIETWIDKVERVKEEKILKEKENIIHTNITTEQKCKLKMQYDEYIERLQLSKKVKEENDAIQKEKDLKRKEKLAKKILGGEISCKLDLVGNPKENNELSTSMNSMKYNRGSEARIEKQDRPNSEKNKLRHSSVSVERNGSIINQKIIFNTYQKIDIKDRDKSKELNPIELQKNEAYRQTFESEKKKRSNSSTCIIKSKNMPGQSETYQRDHNPMEEIKEIDPEERRRRKEMREKIEQKQLEHLRKMQQYKDEIARKQEEDIKKKERMREKLQKEIVGDVKKRTLEELCKPIEIKKPEEPENKGPKRAVDWEYLNSLSQVSDAQVCISDWDHFRRKFKLTEDIKVCIIENSYKDSRKALLARGWFENPDFESQFYDLKMTVKIQSIDWQNIEKGQSVNHFQKGPSLLTTKKNLTQYIECLQYYEEGINIDSFFPKCFYLGSAEELNNFLYQFKFNQCCCVLRKFIDQGTQFWDIRFREVIVAYQVLNRKFNMPNDLNLDDNLMLQELLSDSEWDIIMNHNMPIENQASNNDLYYQLVARYYKSLSFKCGDNSYYRMKEAGLIKDLKLVNDGDKMPHYSLDKHSYNFDKVYLNVNQLMKLIRKDVSYQNSINGDCNMWIMKPSDLSRGRGIQVHNDINKIFNYINDEKDVFVAQKYIERPLIIRKRKFDIRQWVLVTDFNPLTIFIYNECYVRFALDEYDPSNESIYAHLTNNSIVKYADNWEKFQNDDDIDFKGLMWSHNQISKYIQDLSNGVDLFNEKTMPEIEKICNYTFMSVQDEMDACQTTKNSFEMFGFDFMLDDNYNPWLIEVNLSPDMSYSTAITEKLVKTMGEDIIKVVVDNKGKKITKDNDYGNFKLIYKGKYYERPSNLLINNLSIESCKIKNLRKI